MDGGGHERDPWIGRQLAGCVLRELLGAGGMGAVYRAEQVALARAVAVKVLTPQLAARPKALARFEQEARAAARLNHPHTVTIYDYGVSDGTPFLVMELIRGGDLASLLACTGALPASRAVAIALAVLDAVGDAHRHGIVHRDLKPENVLVGNRNDGGELIKVVDFGLADLLDRQTRLTEPELVVATPGFASPEQVRGERATPRSDLYSIGALLFEMLAGRPAFADTQPTAIITAQLTRPAPDPREVAPERCISAALASVCLRAMERDPAARFASAAEMACALRVAARPRSGTLAPAPALPRPLDSTLPPPADADAALCTTVDLIDGLRLRTADSVRVVAIVGAPGAGKTTVLDAAAERAAAAGDVVVRAGAHPTMAPVAWHLARTVVEGLAPGVRWEKADAAVRAGARVLAASSGAAPVCSRPGAVAALLAAAVERSAPRDRAGRTVIVVDDVDAGDELSLRALALLQARHRGSAVLLLLAFRDRPRATEFTEMQVAGLAGDEGAARRAWVADALAGLRPAERRWLQAAAVCGGETSCERVTAVAGTTADPAAIDPGLVTASGWTLRMAPHVREALLASMPAEVQRELHDRALQVGADLPLEARALHAAAGTEGLSSLMMLERAGDDALAHGAVQLAVRFYERALERTRRAHARSQDDLLESALLVFARKLGGALVEAGRPAEASGILVEALAWGTQRSAARVAIRVALARACSARGRRRDALAELGRAMEELHLVSMPPVERAEVWTSLAEVRAAAADLQGAEQALEEAARLIPPERSVLAARIAFGLGSVRAALATSDAERAAARRALIAAAAHAGCAGEHALRGEALGAAAELDELAGDVDLARRTLENAVASSATAGDLESLGRWGRARARLDDGGRREGEGATHKTPSGTITRDRALIVVGDPATGARLAGVIHEVGIEARVARGATEVVSVLEVARSVREQWCGLLVVDEAAIGRDLGQLERLLELLAFSGARPIPVVLLSARDDRETRASALRMGVRAVLPRTRTLDDVREVVRSLRPPSSVWPAQLSA